jgi:exopolysaccharide biosynthesis polyprenyl glycosylphosphotransferase
MIFRTQTFEVLAPRALVAGDIAGIAVMYAVAVAVTLPEPFMIAAVKHFPHLLFFAGCWLGVSGGQGHWLLRHVNQMAALFGALLKASAYAAVCSMVLTALAEGNSDHAGFLVVFLGGSMAAIAVVRLAMLAAMATLRRTGRLRRRVLIVGANERTEQLVERLRCGHHYTVIGVLDDETVRGLDFCGSIITYMGKCGSLSRMLREYSIDDLFIGLPLRSNFETIRRIGQTAQRRGVAVHMLTDLFQSQHAPTQPMHLREIPLLSLSPVSENRLALAAKRAIDFVGSSALLVALSPLFLLTAVVIKLDSKGPVFFLQERAGCNQRRFKMVKFRTMVANAEELRPALAAQNEVQGPAFKLSADPRVTRVGTFMRKHSIDELPQLINVWKGEMSLVGPRPAVAADAGKYSLDQRRRLSVKQGMTGLWQVSGRHALSFEEWLRLDLDYIDSWNLLQDFVILLKTFREVVQGKNAT